MVLDGESAPQAAIFDAVIDAIVTADADGRIVSANRAAEEMFGHRREDMAGELVADVLVPPEFQERHRAGLRRYVETGETTILGRRVRVEAMRVDGSVFPVELTVTRADAEPTLPARSLATNVTTVVPTGRTPGASEFTSRGPLTMSCATAEVRNLVIAAS